MARRNRRAVRPQALEMELDGFANQPFGLRNRFTGGDATGKVRDICRVIAARILNDNGVAHGNYLIS